MQLQKINTLLMLKNGVPHVGFTLEEETFIGRSSTCRIQLLDPQLSRTHTKLFFSEEDWWIEDLQSQNGTYHLGKRITEPIRLRDGDEIRLGSHQFIYNPPLNMLQGPDISKTVYMVNDSSTEAPFAVPLADDASAELSQNAWQLIYDTVLQLTSSPHTEELLKTLLDNLVIQFNASRGFILLKQRPNGPFKPIAVHSPHNKVAVSQTLIQMVTQKQRAILLRNAIEDVSFKGAQSIIEHKLCAVMMAPLIIDGSVQGIIQLDRSKENAFDQTTLAMLNEFAKGTAITIENIRRHEQLRLKQQESDTTFNRSPFVGKTPAIKQLLHITQKAAGSDARVLITGPSGTGKELIAKMLHEQSERKLGPWVAVNCGALPETTIESALFGHEKGAFTGAADQKKGCFELADNGTLFLDEIGELPLSMQVKLLRALQENHFYRLGSERPIQVDVRVISATNQNLEQMVKDGTFREDLYYRLNVINLSIPPLCERQGDIEPLARFFLNRFSARTNIQPPTLSPQALKTLERHTWPGNVRELQNTIERCLVLCEGTLITEKDLFLGISNPGGQQRPPLGNLHHALATTEHQIIEAALKETGGNKAAACRILEISRPTMDKKILEYNIEL